MSEIASASRSRACRNRDLLVRSSAKSVPIRDRPADMTRDHALDLVDQAVGHTFGRAKLSTNCCDR
ncbi:hypothetical protein [Roseovarius sp.]|uniref:hypothetical protein n=1 Tax=Roseovarius sp. TaxID=1486281 RepID=UPI003A97E780